MNTDNSKNRNKKRNYDNEPIRVRWRNAFRKMFNDYKNPDWVIDHIIEGLYPYTLSDAFYLAHVLFVIRVFVYLVLISIIGGLYIYCSRTFKNFNFWLGLCLGLLFIIQILLFIKIIFTPVWVLTPAWHSYFIWTLISRFIDWLIEIIFKYFYIHIFRFFARRRWTRKKKS